MLTKAFPCYLTGFGFVVFAFKKVQSCEMTVLILTFIPIFG